MKRVLTAIGLSVGAVALATGTAVADVPTPVKNDPRYPVSKGYYWVDDTITVPKNYACDVAVTVRSLGHQRDFYNGKLLKPEDDTPLPEPKPGDRFKGESPDEIFVVTNTKTKERVTRPITGTFYDTVQKNGRDLRSRGVGKNVYFAPGITGILWADGEQRFTVTKFQEQDFSIHMTRITGRTVELCNAIGAWAVRGKTLPPPAK